MDTVEEQLQVIGAEPERLPYNTLQVEIPEVDVSIVCEMDGLKSVFMLNHLVIKSVHNTDQGTEYRKAARAFFDGHDGSVPRDIETFETLIRTKIQ